MTAVLVLGGVLGSCGDDAPSATTATTISGRADPAAAAADWLDAIGAGRSGEASSLVADEQFAVVVAIENGLGVADLAALLTAGVPADAEREYWQSFASSFADFAAAPIEDVDVGAVREFDVNGNGFAVVELGLSGGSTTVLAAEAGGRWRIDLLGTLAPALVVQLRELAAGLEPGADGDVVREALVRMVPSLRAAAEQPGARASDDVLRVLEALVRFLAPGLGG